MKVRRYSGTFLPSTAPLIEGQTPQGSVFGDPAEWGVYAHRPITGSEDDTGLPTRFLVQLIRPRDRQGLLPGEQLFKSIEMSRSELERQYKIGNGVEVVWVPDDLRFAQFMDVTEVKK